MMYNGRQAALALLECRYDSPTHIHLKICENIQTFCMEIFKLLVSDRSPQEAFSTAKNIYLGSTYVFQSKSPNPSSGVSSRTKANDVLSTLLRPNCDSVCIGLCHHWNLSSCGVRWVDTAKLRTSDDSGNYRSPSSRSLVLKIVSVENPNTIHSVKCQCSPMS